ncbi:uncharacterized protein G2W53_006973 [Senna tora]|uniref:Uncharacterized protein n=1 Tax=Senna tora TaxID=362788 RepID=A0A834X5A9_9FABA|nr:uncharacterized protein G2W53_006973 [Senna tora]
MRLRKPTDGSEPICAETPYPLPTHARSLTHTHTHPYAKLFNGLSICARWRTLAPSINSNLEKWKLTVVSGSDGENRITDGIDGNLTDGIG